MRQYDNIPKNMLQRLVSNVKEKLASVAFSGKLSDAENDTNFRPIIHTTKQEYEALPEDKLTDGKMYLTEDESPESNVVGLVDINEAINGVVLWENPDPSAEFAAQTVTLNDNIEKYEYVEATYIIEKTNINIKGATGKIEKNALQNFRFVITYINGFMYIRDVYTIDGKNVQISDCYERPQYGTFDSEITNAYLIPIKIIGYPKADFAAIDGILPDAKSVSFDNSNSGLAAGNVQDAVDEINEKINDYQRIGVNDVEYDQESISLTEFVGEKNGNIVHLYMYIGVLKSIGENNTVITIPEGFRSRFNYYKTGILYYGPDIETTPKIRPYIRVRASGAISFNAIPQQSLMVDTTYVADS